MNVVSNLARGKIFTASIGSVDSLYEGHPIKNETFFIVRKSVCVLS